jgi:transcriptional regulator with XRE-family HTH domain
MYANLKLQMWRTGMRQNRLARLLELDETVLSRIVNGFRQPCPEIRAKIAHALKCDAQWLFEDSHTEESSALNTRAASKVGAQEVSRRE